MFREEDLRFRVSFVLLGVMLGFFQNKLQGISRILVFCGSSKGEKGNPESPLSEEKSQEASSP